MHAVRLATGTSMGVLTILLIFVANIPTFSAAVLIASSWALYEWVGLLTQHKLIRLAVLLIYWLGCWGINVTHSRLLVNIASLWWLLAIVLVVLYPRVSFWLKSKVFVGALGVFTLLAFSLSALIMKGTSQWLLFYVVMVVCFADTFAYFIGTHFGRYPLAPKLSPKKSVEGLLGAIVGGVLVAMAVAWFIPNEKHYFPLIAVGFVTIIISTFGDLFESLLKRHFNVKDSGALLPGHGGMLDRLDSLIAALPVFVVLCNALSLFPS